MSDDEDQLSRHESESNDDEETESEHETAEDAKGDDGSVAHGSESSKPRQKDDEDARSQASVESRETSTSDLFLRSIPPSPIPQADATQPPGLYINQNYWSNYDDYDVITVHGLRDDRHTAWKTENGNWWVKDQLFAKLTAREIDFSYHTHEDANIFKEGGIAEEARKLLDEYVAMRRDLPSTETDRPVIWICHDIGGQIVKQALMFAAMQPKIYERIALLTTCILFLGVPHRSRSMEELEDQLHHLLMLPGLNDIKKSIVQKVRGLAEEVSAINTQFFESNLNTRAQVINIFTVPPEPIKPQENDKGEASKESESEAKPEPSAPGDEPSKDEPVAAESTSEPKVETSTAQEDTKKQDNDDPEADEKPESDDSSPDLPPLITPFPRYNALMGYPFETHDRYRVAISHLDLVKGDPDDDERWISSYSDLFNTTGFTVQLNYRLLQNQGNILAMVPPRKTTNLPFEPDLPKPPFITWIYEQEPYKAFRKKDFGPAVLYLHGGGENEPDHATRLDISRLSQTFYLNHDLDTFEERNLLERGIVYFEFNKRDSRYNNIRAMLTTFLNDIIWHFWDDLDETMTDLFENLNRYQSWTLEDLYHVFSHLRDFIGAESLTFFISRFDECDAEERKWFLERVLELQSLSDAMYKIIISTSGPDDFLTKAIPESSIINLGKCPALLEDQKLSSLNEMHSLEDEMRALLKRRTIYQCFENQIKDLIDQCKEEPTLGHSILRFLGSHKRGAPQAVLRKIIRKLSPVTPRNLLKVFFRALGPKKEKQARVGFRWIRHAAEPLTPEILSQAIALSYSQDEEVSLQDIDPLALRRDLEKAFAGLVIIDGRDVRFGHDALYDMTDFDPEGSSAESSAAIHGQIAETCLRCLRMREGQDILAATVSVEQYGGLEAGAIMLPRSSLAEYAVKFWSKHYILAGECAPTEQALQFFQDKDALHTWAEADYVVSNAFTRVQYSYFSPLPYMTRLGLDDLALKYLEIQKSESSGSKYLQNHSYWDAITEAARNGNKGMVLRLLDIVEMDESRLRDAIFWAASYGKGGALDDLIAKARGLDGFSWPPLILGRAATAGLETLIRALADTGYNMNEPIMSSDDRPSIFLAVDWGQEGAVRSLIESKVDFTTRDKYENTPLLLACKRAKPGPVKLMLDAGVDLKALDKNGGTVVHCAVDFARSKILEVLLDAGAESNSGNSDPEADVYTRIPIVHGADRGYEQCVRILLEHNADAKAESPQGTALYLAVQTGHVEITRMLLEKGADPNQTYMDKDMLLLRAIATKKKDLVELLIDNPYNNTAKIDAFDPSGPSYNTPLVRSIENFVPDIVKLLLDKNADVNFVGEGSDSALFAASYFGYVDITKELLARNADMTWHSTDGWTPLHAAYNNPEILEILLEKGADINGSSNDGSVLMIASRWGYTKSVKYLLSRTPKPDLEVSLQNEGHLDNTCTALLIACRYGQADCVKLLLEAGAKADHKTNDGSYALELCLERGGPESEDTLRELLKFSPNLKDTDSNGDTVLHSIKETTPLSVVQLLIEKGASAHAANKDGNTPLSVAIGQGNKEVARYLVHDCKVNVNVYGPKFGSALHLAAGKDGDLDMVKLLIEAKADHSAVDRDYGESVLYTAFSNYDYRMRGKIVRYLVETAGVDVNARGGRMAYPIIRAAAESNESLLKYLIRRQADFNVSDDLGRRPIHLAAATGENSVMALVRAGAELNVRDKYGRSPVHFAAGTGDVRVLEILLKPPPEEGFQTSLVDVDGWTPLMWACRSCWLEWTRQEILDKLIDDSKETLWSRSKDNEWSPLKLANYHGWADEFKDRLAPPEDQRTRTDRDGQEISWNNGFHKTREAIIRFGASCASCTNTIRGIQWKCVECSEEFNLCFKCFPHRSTMHDKEHHFEEIGPQFEAASSRASSVARSSEEQSEEESDDDEEESEEEENDGEEDNEGSGEDNDDDD